MSLIACSRNSHVLAGCFLVVALIVTLLFVGLVIAPVSADEEEPNVALRMFSFKAPNVVGLNSTFPVSVDVQYYLHGRPNNATIRAAIYQGSIDYSNPLWESQSTFVTGGGEKIWNATLTAPAAEGYMKLTACAYFLENASWYFYNSTVNGPGFGQVTIKVAKVANLDVQLRMPGITITIDNAEVKTSANGDGQMTVTVGIVHNVSVPFILEFQNSTRAVFSGWNDGVAQTQRSIAVNGDVKLTCSYKTQYLVRVQSVRAVNSSWYDRGSTVVLQEPVSFPMSGLLGLLGGKYDFADWSGSVNSTSPRVSVTVYEPANLYANYSADYAPVGIVTIAVTGAAAVTLFLLLLAKRRGITPGRGKGPSVDMRCNSCGMEIEAGWSYCDHCGAQIAEPKR